MDNNNALSEKQQQQIDEFHRRLGEILKRILNDEKGKGRNNNVDGSS